ncbi:MAG: helix-turn-helix domain-containing protein [Advenella sp.]|uniref:helix-turn-helix domain-containing protein n=1 Tax=Advenella sp. TaxID=1872388 RepID=UPI003F9D0F67
MHTPVQPGIPRFLQDGVFYQEHHPDPAFGDQIYCLWQLRTTYALPNDCHYLVVPDACIDLVFDLSEQADQAVLVMSPGIRALDLNLGRQFHYCGIRLYPGVWRGSQHIIAQSQTFPSLGGLDMPAFIRQLSACSEADQQQLLQHFVRQLTMQGIANDSAWMPQLLAQADRLTSVDDLVRVSGYSRRHLQRLFSEKTGFSAHDFLKILRFHQALTTQRLDAYTDQSHYIREFKRITGITPVAFQKKYR